MLASICALEHSDNLRLDGAAARTSADPFRPCVCVCVCVSVCVCACVRVYAYIHTALPRELAPTHSGRLCVYVVCVVCVSMHTYIHTVTHKHTHTAHTHTQNTQYKHIYMHVYIHIYTDNLYITACATQKSAWPSLPPCTARSGSAQPWLEFVRPTARSRLRRLLSVSTALWSELSGGVT